MGKLKSVCWVLGLVIFLAGPVFGFEILESGYVAEIYATFETPENNPAQYMAFGPDGNLYVTWYDGNYNDFNGMIYRVEPDGTASEWVGGFVKPAGIIWAGGTAYGESFLVAETWGNQYGSDGQIMAVELDGSVSQFSIPGLFRPVCLGIDTVGNYGGLLYTGTGAWDGIMKVLPTGEVQDFHIFPGDTGGSPMGIVFDTSGNYGGLMYVATAFGNNPGISGLLTFDPDGNPSRFAPEMLKSYGLAFDTTEDQMFGWYLYTVGYEPRGIFRVYPDGQIEEFIRKPKIATRMTFGPDGAMYMMESGWGDTTVTISRIYYSPYTVATRLISEALDDKQKCAEAIEATLDKELEAYRLLDVMLQIQFYEGLAKNDIVRAKQTVHSAMQQQEQTLDDLNKSIANLQGSLELLGIYLFEEASGEEF